MIIQTGWHDSTGMTGNAFNSSKSDHYFSMPIKEYINDKLSLDGYCRITSLTLTCTGWIECFWPGEFKMDIGYGGNGSISTYLLQGGSICGADNNAEKTFTVNLKDIISGKQVSYSKGSYITFRIYSSAVGTKSYEVENVYLDVQCSNHSWTNATCTTPNKCSVCGVTEGSALGHSWVNATCTTPKTCSRCGTTEGSALGHTEQTIPAVPATCTATGFTEGKKCSVCNTILVAQQTTPALGHSYTEIVIQPTENSHGYTRHTCSRCGHYYDDGYTYLVRWYNEDGSVLLETDPAVPHGTMPECSVTPTKPATAQYSYTHAGWAISPTAENTTALTAVVANIKYYARFTRSTNTYTVTWKNDDGTTLETDTLVPYGTPPDYNGATPKKASTVQYDYTFLGWSAKVEDPPLDESNLPTVSGHITYTAVYLPVVRKYDLYIVAYDCIVEGAVSGTYEYGTAFTIKVTPVFGYEFDKILDESNDIEYTSDELTFMLTGDTTLLCECKRAPAPVFASSTQQVKEIYVVPAVNTIVYIVEGDLPTLETKTHTVDDWHFAVINTAIENSIYEQYLYYSVDKLFINETRIW